MPKRKNRGSRVGRGRIIRKNADDKLRAAERAFKQDPTIGRQIAYWRACIRAGITPEPTEAMSEVSWWIIDDRRFSSVPVVGAFTDSDIVSAWGRNMPTRQYKTVLEALEVIIQAYLPEVEERGFSLDYWYGGKKNPDDRLRKLERASRSNHYEDVIRYWSACLRAGILPQPTRIHESEYGKLEEWLLRFSPKGLANYWVGRRQAADGIIEVGGLTPFGLLRSPNNRYQMYLTARGAEEELRRHIESMVDPKEVALVLTEMEEREQRRLDEEDYIRRTYGPQA